VRHQLIAIDVGAGTTDIVVRRDDEPPESSVKLVVPSQTRVVAARIAAATRSGAAVLFAGPTMGGGADTRAMKAHTGAGLPFLATESAALSFADDLDRVRGRGVQIVAEDEAAALARQGSLGRGAQKGGRRDLVVVRSGDVDAAALLGALQRLGVDTRFAGAAVAVQDHGFCPAGSNRVFRFSLWERAVRERRRLCELFHWAGGIPAPLTRMRAAAGCSALLLHPAPSSDEPPSESPARLRDTHEAPRGAILAGDTGPAALLGTLADVAPADSDTRRESLGTSHKSFTTQRTATRAAAATPGEIGAPRRAPRPDDAIVLVNVGNGHTIAAVARGDRLCGVYEHHTGLLDSARLELHLRRFLAGDLAADEVRADGGHGAVLDEPVTPSGPLLVTGPNRRLLRSTHMELRYPAPWGDMMIAGAVGLLEAYRQLR
jgi:uncharacterized protein (DUF1786 family)